MPRLAVQELVKNYPSTTDLLRVLRRPWSRREVTALRGIDLELEPGRIYGLVGPNGAGKTTLLKVLAGLVLPTRGQVVLDGQPPTARASRDAIGFVVSDERSFHWRLSVRENLRFFAALQGLQNVALGIDRALERVDLTGYADRDYRELSTGLRQRLAVARGLLVDPPILLLDEATRSLDPAATRRLHEWIQGEFGAGSGRLLIYSTHDLAEIEELCTDLIILRDGRILARHDLGNEGPLEVRSYDLRARSSVPDSLLDGVPGLEQLRVEGTSVQVRVTRAAAIDEVVDRLRAAGIGILSLKPLPVWVDDLFGEDGS